MQYTAKNKQRRPNNIIFHDFLLKTKQEIKRHNQKDKHRPLPTLHTNHAFILDMLQQQQDTNKELTNRTNGSSLDRSSSPRFLVKDNKKGIFQNSVKVIPKPLKIITERQSVRFLKIPRVISSPPSQTAKKETFRSKELALLHTKTHQIRLQSVERDDNSSIFFKQNSSSVSNLTQRFYPNKKMFPSLKNDDMKQMAIVESPSRREYLNQNHKNTSLRKIIKNTSINIFNNKSLLVNQHLKTCFQQRKNRLETVANLDHRQQHNFQLKKDRKPKIPPTKQLESSLCPNNQAPMAHSSRKIILQQKLEPWHNNKEAIECDFLSSLNV